MIICRPLLRDAVLDHLTGLGTGRLRDLFDAILAGGERVRRLNIPVRLALEHDRHVDSLTGLTGCEFFKKGNKAAQQPPFNLCGSDTQHVTLA